MRSRETIFLEGELASQLADWHRKKGCRKLTSGTELARESISEQDYRHSVYRCMQNILVCRSTYLLQPSQNRDIDQLASYQLRYSVCSGKGTIARQLDKASMLARQIAHNTAVELHQALSQQLGTSKTRWTLYQPILYYYYYYQPILYYYYPLFR